MTLVVLKIQDGLKEKFVEVVCTNSSEDPDQDWMQPLCYDEGFIFTVDCHDILDIQKYEVS